ncbi:MAG: hypothetical protein ACFFCQ_04080 [Promethearchaeota archaeon]
MHYQDVISKKPIPIKNISPDRDNETFRLLTDPNYFPIIKALRKRPMTMKELEEEYNKIAEEKKSNKTLYRYLNTLKKAELVIPVGQRVVIGKTATETLYGRSAKVFLLHEDYEGWWWSQEGEQLALKINLLVSKVLNTEEAPLECLQKFLTQLTTKNRVILDELVEKEETAQLFLAEDLDEIVSIAKTVGRLSVLLKEPDMIKHLHACYQKK